MGWSSLSMIMRALAMREALEARTISEFERGSHDHRRGRRTAGARAGPRRGRRRHRRSFCTVCTMSEATAFFSGTTSSSAPRAGRARR
jgi:hypothetical protein